MADRIDVHLKEYEQLRHELVHRIGLAYALITLNLTVLGAGLTVLQRLPAVGVGLAIASSSLWLFFIDHASQVYKIAAYIALRIGPAVRTVAPEAFRWEEFVRELDAGGSRASRVLYPGQSGPAPQNWIVSGGPSRYLAALFGGSPPILLIAFIVSSGFDGSAAEVVLRFVVLLAGLGIWAIALTRYRAFRRTVSAINEAISASYRNDQASGGAPAGA
ncbi:hypothetical protein [Actinoplanes friuliensis]|uniref:Uncharacterized protein n=1 Tax=Actinoplanes friuliensis DSM 7358 TaxID=1246995 RepID=U5W494_9ACTN|nr:hypothetical protein [Actinoplanes friuliensis]AGZ43842.1 hypothetical protein AFR_27905 [Actinoplanes friuliensis DSM 7358]